MDVVMRARVVFKRSVATVCIADGMVEVIQHTGGFLVIFRLDGVDGYTHGRNDINEVGVIFFNSFDGFVMGIQFFVGDLTLLVNSSRNFVVLAVDATVMSVCFF